MTSADDRDPIAAAERLEQTMIELATDVRGLADYGHRNRLMIRILIGVVVAIVGLGVALGVVALEARDATSAAAQAKQNAQVTCQVGNESRRLQNQLWTYVLDIASRNPQQTPAQREQVAIFRAYVNQVFAPRDCSVPPTVTSPTAPPR